jgi:hypothetical protein
VRHYALFEANKQGEKWTGTGIRSQSPRYHPAKMPEDPTIGAKALKTCKRQILTIQRVYGSPFSVSFHF